MLYNAFLVFCLSVSEFQNFILTDECTEAERAGFGCSFCSKGNGYIEGNFDFPFLSFSLIKLFVEIVTIRITDVKHVALDCPTVSHLCFHHSLFGL